jgi:hypothetical protein
MQVHWLRKHASRLEGDLAAFSRKRDMLVLKGIDGIPADGDWSMFAVVNARYRAVRAQRVVLRRELLDARARVEALVRQNERLNAEARSVVDLNAQVDAQSVELAARAASRREAEIRIAQISAQLEGVLASKSWRITRPLRALRYPFRNSIRLLRRIAGAGVRTLARRPGMRRIGGHVLRRCPWLHDRVIRTLGPQNLYVVGKNPHAVRSPESGPLSPIASMYASLLNGTDQKRKNTGGDAK